jgi:NAD(P)-dependent dehydrogenase (short-subunit alcohol dehydrogenase family)
MNQPVALITGGGVGIGRATAFELARRNYTIILGEIDPEAGSATARELEKKGYTVLFQSLDMTREESVAAAFAEANHHFGYVSLLVNNVGHYAEMNFEQMSKTDWEKELSINLTSVFLGTKYGVPLLEKSHHGRVIVNLSSNLATIAEPLAPAYCAAKAGVNMLTRCLALEYARKGIRVVAVAPGPVGRSEYDITTPPDPEEVEFSKLNPLGRFAYPEEVASLIAYIASEEAAYMTGCTIALDGGETANPVSWSVMKRIKEEGKV